MSADKRPKILVCGCHEYGQHLIPRLVESGIQFDQFLVLSPEQGAQHRISGYHDLRPLAEEAGVPVYVPERYDLTGDRDVEFFRNSSFDLLVQGGWQRLFPNHVLESLRIGAIGVHGSPEFLPKGRGRSPLNWALINGETRFILQLFLMQAGADDGPVFDWEIFDITPYDSIETLYLKNIILSDRMIQRSIPKLMAGTAELRPQEGEPTYFPKRDEGDGEIDWEGMNVFQIYNLVRALTRPYPGAFGEIEGASYKIWRAQIFDTRITYPEIGFGMIAERFEDRLIINCRGGLLLLDDFEPMTPGLKA